jgi:hypothetical protein
MTPAVALRVPFIPQSNSSLAVRRSITTSRHLRVCAAVTGSEAVMPVLDLAPDPEERDRRGYVSQLWAEDWDCPEDSIYDTW